MEKRSEELSAFGKAYETYRAIVNGILKEGGSDEDLVKIRSNPKLARKIGALVRQTTALPYDDYGDAPELWAILTREERIELLGYFWKASCEGRTSLSAEDREALAFEAVEVASKPDCGSVPMGVLYMIKMALESVPTLATTIKRVDIILGRL